MNFVDLYRFAQDAAVSYGKEISVESLRRKIISDHPTVGDVVFYNIDKLDPAVSRGHAVLYLDRSSGYGDEHIVASVRLAKNQNRCWRRFVGCKELMHVFDPSLSRTANRDHFFELLDELENNPIYPQASDRFQSERIAEWQALFALCPKSHRATCLDMNKAGKSHREIAEFLAIPEVYIGAILGRRYEVHHEYIIGEPI